MTSRGAPVVRERRSYKAMTAATREKLILAAEKLFASRGIEAVSLREIGLKAGQGNNSAVVYHFGGKDQLVYEIFRYRVAQMEGPRGAMFADAERQGRLGDAKSLFGMICLPYLDLVDDTGVHTYAAFLSEYVTRHRPIGMRHPSDDAIEGVANLVRIQSLLRARIFYVPPAIAEQRIVACALMFTNMLVRHDTAARLDGTPSRPPPQMIDDTLEMMAAALCLPYRPPE